MGSHREPRIWPTWLLAVVLTVLAGGLAYLWGDPTVSARACAGGARDTLGAAGLAVIWLAVPIGVVWQARRAGASAAQAAIPAILGALLALVSVWLGAQVWWAGHNCMT